MEMTRRQQDQQSKLIDELSTLIQTILTFSPTTSIESPDGIPAISAAATGGSSSSAGGQAVRRREFSLQQITPSGFAACLLGISLTLMLCGSVIFFLGFMLMPWVLGLISFLYVVGVISSLSMLGRAIFCPNSTPSSPRKEFSNWKVL